MTRFTRLRAMFLAMLLFPATSAFAAFIGNGDGTMTDSATGLVWDKCSWGQAWVSGTNTCSDSDDASTHTWAEALGAAITANDANHHGHDDWRLPNLTELESLLALSAANPAIDTTAFPNTPSNRYWTSTTYALAPTFAWFVGFDDGGTSATLRSNPYHVRLVRGGSAFDALESAAEVVNGACGAADGAATAFMPSADLCAAGSAGAVTEGSPWTWMCTGSGGGTNTSCSAPNQTTPSSGGDGRAVVSGDAWVVDADQSAGFIPVSGHEKSPPDLPAGYDFPHGLLDFTLVDGTPGTAATITITYPSDLPEGTVYWKYGPSPEGYDCTGAACAEAHWYRMPPGQAVISGNTITLTITDGGVGDDDLAANGIIVDQGGPGVPANHVPTLSEWATILLAGLVALFGWGRLRRVGRLRA